MREHFAYFCFTNDLLLFFIVFELMEKPKTKMNYTKLTARQRLEILDYWSRTHYPYSVICSHFSEKWHQEVRKSTVGDLVLEWKKSNSVRGSNKVECIDRTLHMCVKELMLTLESQKLEMTDELIYQICYGEVMNRGFNVSSLTLEQVKQLLSLYHHSDVESYLQDNLNLEDVLKLQLDHSPLHTFYLDTFQLLFRCIPYQSYCYLFDSKYLTYRERMEVLLVFSADGNIKFNPFISGDRFSTSIDRMFSITSHRHGVYKLVLAFKCSNSRTEVSAEELSQLLLWLDTKMDGNENILFLENLHFLIELVENGHDCCVMTFHASKPLSIKLYNIRVYLVNNSDFVSISPLNRGMHKILKKNYAYSPR